MAETMRCPSCGALNRVDAQWCNQCLKQFKEPEPEPEPASEREPRPTTPSRRASTGVPLEVIEDPLGTPIDIGLPLDRPPAGRVREEAARERAAPTYTVTPPAHAVGTERGAFRVKEHGVVW